MKAKATQLAPITEGVPFLGFIIYPSLIRLKRENLVRMRKKIKDKEKKYVKGLVSKKDLIESVNSMISHVAYVSSKEVRKDIFTESLNMAW